MPDAIIDLLRSNYNEEHGVTNVRPVVDELLAKSRTPFPDIAVTFRNAEPRWRLPILEAMRALCVVGRCTQDDAELLMRATETVAADSGNDEYFKSINALVASRRSAPALISFVARWLRVPQDEFTRRLAFYVVGMLLEHQTAEITDEVWTALKSAADSEGSDKMKAQFADILGRLTGMA